MTHKNKLPERYPNIIAMYARGHANSLEILKTDFGHWPPNGLDIVNAPDIDVKFKSVFSTQYGLKRLKPSWMNLLISLNLLKSHPVSAVAFMAVTAAIRGAELGGFVDIKDKPETIHLNDMYRAFGFFQGGRRFLSHVISHEFKHVVQARDHMDSLSSALGDRLHIKKMLKPKTSKMGRYLSEECEIQARLHTVIVGLYHQHEALPLSKRELIAVLAAQGLKVPVEVLGKFVNHAAENKWKRDDGLYNRYADKDAVKDLNRVVDAIKPDKLYEFFSKTLPFIYGDLLELYGDSQGQKRMGHQHNIQLREIFYKSAQSYRRSSVKLRTKENIQESISHMLRSLDVIDMMDADDAVSLAFNIIRGSVYREYGEAERVSKNNPLGKLSIERVLARKDLTPQHRLLVENANNGSNDESEMVISIRRWSPKPNKRNLLAYAV